MKWVAKSAAEEEVENTDKIKAARGKGEKSEKTEKGDKASGKGKDAGKSKDVSKGWNNDSKGKGGKGGKGKDSGKDFSKGGKNEGKGGKSDFDEWKGGKKGGGKSKAKDDFDDARKGSSKSKKGTGKAPVDKNEKNNRSEDAKRQVLVEKGKHCEVKKHSSIGCAVVTFIDARVRSAVLSSLGDMSTIGEVQVKLKPHQDKDTKSEVPTDLFVGWGRQAEKNTPLSELVLVKYFDDFHERLTAGGRLDEIAARATAIAGVRPGPFPAPAAPPAAFPCYNPHAQAAMLQQQQWYHQQYMIMHQMQQTQMYHQQMAAMAAGQAAARANQTANRDNYRAQKATYRCPTDDELNSRVARLNQSQAAAAAAAQTPAAAAAAALASAVAAAATAESGAAAEGGKTAPAES